jgi:hypothetical protein
MGKRYPAGMENILWAINIPTRGRVKSAENRISNEIKEWELKRQFVC